MEKNNSSDQVQRLQRHLEKVKTLLTNSKSDRTPAQQEAYTAWVNLEIKRTQRKIDYLTQKPV
jgi:hypothetical protein